MKQWLLADHPKGRPLKSEDFKLAEVEVPSPGPGEALLKVQYLGFDPAQKGWMENVADYVAPMQIGDVMRGTGLAEVVESRHDGMPVGSLWTGMTGWSEYCLTKGAGYQPADDSLSPTASLSVLGLTGMTAWCGLYKIGKPVPGDTLVVSGAAGATGSLVGQLAKTSGCRVIGIAGGPEKCDWLVTEAGFDAAIDYKGEDIKVRLKELAPKGVQIVFDNVGGSVLDDMLAHLAHQARVVICGGISRYETGDLPAGPQNYFNLIFRRAKMEGFIVLDYEDEFPAIRKRLVSLIGDGRLTWLEDVQHGFENAPETLNRLFTGLNKGKQILKL
ncbi:MAG: NADP-dependent oxidoreductase [Parvibaculales bacterium]